MLDQKQAEVGQQAVTAIFETLRPYIENHSTLFGHLLFLTVLAAGIALLAIATSAALFFGITALRLYRQKDKILGAPFTSIKISTGLGSFEMVESKDFGSQSEASNLAGNQQNTLILLGRLVQRLQSRVALLEAYGEGKDGPSGQSP
jgi:hypothetical protein